MSVLFKKRENDRFMGQDGLPVYEYYEPSFLLRSYRTAVDMMFQPEYLAPLVGSVAAATLSTMNGGSFVVTDSSLLNASSTFAISTFLGLATTMMPDQFLFNFQRPLGIVHSYFDKRPAETDKYSADQKAAGKMKRLHTIFASFAIGGIGIMTYKMGGIAPEFIGPALGLTISPLVSRSRYAKVERSDWAFHEFSDGPPRGRQKPEEDYGAVFGQALAPLPVGAPKPR